MISAQKVAILTGASSDIGVAVTKSLLDAGFFVVAQVFENQSALKCLSCDALQVVKADLSTALNCSKFISDITAKNSRIDFLINTIGPLVHRNILELEPKIWLEQINLNLNLTFFMSHYAQEELIKSRGHIINFAFSGVELLKARLDSTAYCSAKAGVLILTKSLASALIKHGVRVNALSPGLVGLNQTAEERKKFAKDIPFGRAALPEEISSVLTWLLTKSPEYLTGAIIPVSGAWEY
jgi:NAD(P)-dependent dehydrogenase (short-subunit alcohol dehydrogenase family)